MSVLLSHRETKKGRQVQSCQEKNRGDSQVCTDLSNKNAITRAAEVGACTLGPRSQQPAARTLALPSFFSTSPSLFSTRGVTGTTTLSTGMKEERRVVLSLTVRLYHSTQTTVTGAEACVTFG